MTGQYQPPPQLSPDGRFSWNGQAWVPFQTSPDGRHWFNGREWVPFAAPAPGPTPPPVFPAQALPPTNHTALYTGLAACVLLLIVIIGVVAVSQQQGRSTAVAAGTPGSCEGCPSTAPNSTPPPVAPAQPFACRGTTLLSQRGLYSVSIPITTGSGDCVITRLNVDWGCTDPPNSISFTLLLDASASSIS